MEHKKPGEAQVHETAVVDKHAKVGNGTQIWHFSHVSNGAQIGEDCKLGQNVFIGEDVRIGNNVKIQNNVSVYSGVEIEDDAFLGPSCVFTNVSVPRSSFPTNDYKRTLVQRGASIGANATIVCGNIVGAYSLIGAGAVVTRDVMPHSVMVGVPARHTNWACICGSFLVRVPSEERSLLVCQNDGRTYELDADGPWLLNGVRNG